MNKKRSVIILILLMVLIVAASVTACAETLNDNSNTGTVEQGYVLNVYTGQKTNVTQVKLEWQTTDIHVIRNDAKKWDVESLDWVDDDENDTFEVTPGTAKFTLTNLSSVEIEAAVTFETAEYAEGKSFTTPTIVFDESTGTDGKINIATANGNSNYSAENPPKAEINLTITPDQNDFKELTATTGAKFGKYTVTISEYVPECLAKGTKITMGDGSVKGIEDVAENDYVLTFNHEKGMYEAQKVFLTFKGEYQDTAFTLNFDNGNTISIVGEHDLFEKESLKYVTITEGTAKEYIGKHFYSVNDNKYLELVSVTFETTPTEFYSIYTEYSGNAIANGMLTVPDDDDERLNIFEFNEDLSIDHKQLERDIATYGLYEYQGDTKATKEMYDAFSWKYIYIMIGKGYGTMDEFVLLRDAFLAGL